MKNSYDWRLALSSRLTCGNWIWISIEFIQVVSLRRWRISRGPDVPNSSLYQEVVVVASSRLSLRTALHSLLLSQLLLASRWKTCWYGSCTLILLLKYYAFIFTDHNIHKFDVWQTQKHRNKCTLCRCRCLSPCLYHSDIYSIRCHYWLDLNRSDLLIPWFYRHPRN